MIAQLERAAGFDRDDPPRHSSPSSRRCWRSGRRDGPRLLPLLAALLGCRPTAAIPHRRRTRNAGASDLGGAARQLAGSRRPAAGAADSSRTCTGSTLDPLELLGLVIERVRAAAGTGARSPSGRSSSRPGPVRPRHHADPEPSRPAPGEALCARVTGGKPLPAEICQQIVERTDGVPLFVEELTKTVLESGLLARCRRSLRAVRPAAAARDPDDPARIP